MLRTANTLKSKIFNKVVVLEISDPNFTLILIKKYLLLLLLLLLPLLVFLPFRKH